MQRSFLDTLYDIFEMIWACRIITVQLHLYSLCAAEPFYLDHSRSYALQGRW
jgi:hypothetical protein